jgi:hypothetical protein
MSAVDNGARIIIEQSAQKSMFATESVHPQMVAIADDWVCRATRIQHHGRDVK